MTDDLERTDEPTEHGDEPGDFPPVSDDPVTPEDIGPAEPGEEEV